MNDDTGYYINLGSGQRPFKPPFYNVDIQDKWKQFTLDKGCGWMDAEGALRRPLRMVVMHHVLEHYGCGEADGLIGEIYENLVKGGSLIVTVPDLAELAERWLDYRIDTQIFTTNLYGAYMGDEADRHKWGFCYESLKEYLSKWDWDVHRFDYRTIEGADIAKDWRILGMECVKK